MAIQFVSQQCLADNLDWGSREDCDAVIAFCVTAALQYPNSSKTAVGNSVPFNSCKNSTSIFVR